MVPFPVAESTSWSLANVPPVIDTVALARLKLSGSPTATAPDNVTAPPSSVKCALAATLPSVGGSLTPTTLTVSVCTALSSRPSFTVHTKARVVSEP